MSHIPFDISSDYFQILPAHVKDRLQRMAGFRKRVGLPRVMHRDNNSTIAVLVINNRFFWGINKATAGISDETIQTVREALMNENGISVHPIVLSHAESDAIIDAFNHNQRASVARMYVDRKLCGFCAGKNFNGGSLRRMLPLLNLEKLIIYSPDARGRMNEVIMTPEQTWLNFHYQAGHTNAW